MTLHRKRLKDDTFDPFGYDDDPETTKKFRNLLLICLFPIPAILTGIIIAFICKYADVIDKILR